MKINPKTEWNLARLLNVFPDQRPLENIGSDQGSSRHGNSIPMFLVKHTKDFPLQCLVLNLCFSTATAQGTTDFENRNPNYFMVYALDLHL